MFGTANMQIFLKKHRIDVKRGGFLVNIHFLRKSEKNVVVRVVLTVCWLLARALLFLSFLFFI